MSPIVVDPSFIPPPPPATATSSDGYLTAMLDPAWAGVILKADFTSLSALPVKVAFWRDGQKVRSGDTTWAPGGVAVAYDHEAPLGVSSGWTAVPVNADGTLGTASTVAVLTVPNPAAASTNVWLKSTVQPSLSRQVWVETPPQIGMGANLTLTRALGSAYPVGSWDARSGYATQFALVTTTAQQRLDLQSLLDSGPLLYQSASTVDLEDFFSLPGDVTWDYISGAADPSRRWTITVTQIARPATVDAPLVIPGLSWDTVAGSYASWTALAAAKASWTAVLGA
ncbi:MAG: hypothetical protein ACXVXO_00785 [Mycobacteriaceae bacterium]